MDLKSVKAIRWVANPGACPICTPLDGMTWAITEPPLEQAGEVHPNCQCYYEWLDSVPGTAVGHAEYERRRREWAAQWLRDHPPVTARHFRWTDSLTRISTFNPSAYEAALEAELLENATFMTGWLFMTGAIAAPQPKIEREPNTNIEEWGYE